MQSFLTRHSSDVKGVLSGFDRIRFRGTLRWLATVTGLETFLAHSHVLLKEFKPWAQRLTDHIRQSTVELAKSLGRPLRYVYTSQLSKEELALNIAEVDQITQGLICVLTAVEPCRTFFLRRNRERRRLELSSLPGKCLHQYFYIRDPRFGLIYVRQQTWLPFTIYVGINGREWLARDLVRHGIGFEKRDNCFVDLADVSQAQALLAAQLNTDWAGLLNALLKQVYPAHAELFGSTPLHYYWSAEETEWATDMMFRAPEALARLYPRLVRQALTAFGCNDVLRFLGRSPQAWRFHGSEIHSTLKTRPEGVRVKHELNGNSVKMYDKQQTILRVETTINQPRDMRVYRPKEGNAQGPKSWLPLRKGVADLYRRAEVSQKCNERYLDSLATADVSASLEETLEPLCRAKTWRGRRVRGLRPFDSVDSGILAAIGGGQFALNGFRNRDLRDLLFGASKLPAKDLKRQSSKITRLLRLLRAHALIRKIPKTHRYQLTHNGRLAISALRAAQHASVQRLTQLAL